MFLFMVGFNFMFLLFVLYTMDLKSDICVIWIYIGASEQQFQIIDICIYASVHNHFFLSRKFVRMVETNNPFLKMLHNMPLLYQIDKSTSSSNNIGAKKNGVFLRV